MRGPTEGAPAPAEPEPPRVAPRADQFELTPVPPPDGARSSPEPAIPASRPGRWRHRRPTFAVPAGAALVALVAALVVAVAVSGDPSPAQSAALVSHGSSGAHGRVELFDPATRDGRLVVQLKGLRAAPAGAHYTVWVLRSGATEMTPVASLSSGADVQLDLPLPSPGRYGALDISLQRDDASPLRSRVSVAGATIG
jgi:Anti-sigma-K factor rskA